MKRLTDMIWDEELRIAEETAAVDRVFKEVGFEPVKIPDFDPEASVYRGRMMDSASQAEKQAYVANKMLAAKQWKEDGKADEEIKHRVERESRRRAKEFAERKAYEQKQREKLNEKKEFLADCEVECLKLRHQFHESVQVGCSTSEYYMDELIKYRHKQAKCRIDIEGAGHEIYVIRDRLIVCDLFDIDHDNNGMPTKAVDYCGYILYGIFDEVQNEEAKFTMFTVSLSYNITAVCLSFSDRVYVPALIIKAFDGTIGLHEELTVYGKFQRELTDRELGVNINYVSGWISRVMHTIVERQPGFDPEAFVCVKHRLGMVLHDDQSKKLNKCANMYCSDCPFNDYCNIEKLKNQTLINAKNYVYDKKEKCP